MLVKKKMRWPIGGNFELPTWFITRRMTQKKNSLMAEKIGQVFRNSTKKKSIIYFPWFKSYKFVNEALQPRFFAKKMT
jgi:hypothetical protein